MPLSVIPPSTPLFTTIGRHWPFVLAHLINDECPLRQRRHTFTRRWRGAEPASPARATAQLRSAVVISQKFKKFLRLNALCSVPNYCFLSSILLSLRFVLARKGYNSGIATYRVKRGLSLRSKHIFYPCGNATIISPIKAGSKGGRHHNCRHIA